MKVVKEFIDSTTIYVTDVEKGYEKEYLAKIRANLHLYYYVYSINDDNTISILKKDKPFHIMFMETHKVPDPGLQMVE